MTHLATLTSAPILANLSTTSTEAERINFYAHATPKSHRLPEDHPTKHLTEKYTNSLRLEHRPDGSSAMVTVCSHLQELQPYPKQHSKKEFCDLAWKQVASIVDRNSTGSEVGHWRLLLCTPVTLWLGSHHRTLYVCKYMTVHFISISALNRPFSGDMTHQRDE